MTTENNSTVYAVVEDFCDEFTLYGVYSTEDKAERACDELRELDSFCFCGVEEYALDKLTPLGELRREYMEESHEKEKEWEEKENDEQYLDEHPWMRHPWPEAPALKFKEGELIMDFSSPTSARIYKEFASVWAKSVDRLAERLGLTKEAAAHKASLHGFAFLAMSTEHDARDCGYDVVKYLKDLRCHWNTHFKVEEDAMRYMRIAHTVHIADEMYEKSLQIRKWAESFGLQPSELLV